MNEIGVSIADHMVRRADLGRAAERGASSRRTPKTAATLRAVQQVGKAQLGDKTLVDVLAPASDALSRAVASGARSQRDRHRMISPVGHRGRQSSIRGRAPLRRLAPPQR